MTLQDRLITLLQIRDAQLQDAIMAALNAKYASEQIKHTENVLARLAQLSRLNEPLATEHLAPLLQQYITLKTKIKVVL